MKRDYSHLWYSCWIGSSICGTLSLLLYILGEKQILPFTILFWIIHGISFIGVLYDKKKTLHSQTKTN